MGGLFPVAWLAFHLGGFASATCPSPWDPGNATACSCEEAGRFYVACRNCTPSAQCRCHSSVGALNLTDYYDRECHGRATGAAVYAAIAVPLVVLISAAVLAYIFIRRRRGTSFQWDKRASNASDANHGQPRYVSRAGTQGEPSIAGHGEYENVFMDQPPGPRGGRSERRARKSSKTQPPPRARDMDGGHGDQPIYANTQESDVYYNYMGNYPTEAHPDEVYIIPGH